MLEMDTWLKNLPFDILFLPHPSGWGRSQNISFASYVALGNRRASARGGVLGSILLVQWWNEIDQVLFHLFSITKYTGVQILLLSFENFLNNNIVSILTTNRAQEGGSECRVSRSNFWQCRMSTWKWECPVSTSHSVALWIICPI